MESLHESGVHLLTSTKCLEINEYGVVIESKGVVSAYPCDSVVVAIGAKSRSYEGLHTFCDERHIPMHVIGDALRARRALNAVSEAHEVARMI